MNSTGPLGSNLRIPVRNRVHENPFGGGRRIQPRRSGPPLALSIFMFCVLLVFGIIEILMIATAATLVYGALRRRA